MNTAFYTGASGLRAHQYAIDVTSHNLVNANTYGYKATKPEFRELLYSKMDINKNRELENDEKVLSGHGVMLSNQDLIFTQGALANTGYPLDYAIAGDGLFAIERSGNIEYTRNGSFDLSIENGDAYLVTSDGAYVLDDNYNRIQVPYQAGTNVIDTTGLDKRLENSVERSNVDVAKEFADVIVSQKAYQFSARVVSTADEIEQVANSLRK